jgi:hypothetical protein
VITEDDEWSRIESEIKRRAARDEDDDTQVYADTLTIVYQSGFVDGKKAAQRKPLSANTIVNMMPSSIPAEYDGSLMEFARAIEQAHNIKDGT